MAGFRPGQSPPPVNTPSFIDRTPFDREGFTAIGGYALRQNVQRACRSRSVSAKQQAALIQSMDKIPVTRGSNRITRGNTPFSVSRSAEAYKFHGHMQAATMPDFITL